MYSLLLSSFADMIDAGQTDDNCANYLEQTTSLSLLSTFYEGEVQPDTLQTLLQAVSTFNNLASCPPDFKTLNGLALFGNLHTFYNNVLNG